MRMGGYISLRAKRVVLFNKDYPSTFPVNPQLNIQQTSGMCITLKSVVKRKQLPHWSSLSKGDIPMKDLVAHIARELVDKPEEVSVAEVEGNQTSVLELKVAKDDIGKVIGKKGRIAHAIRTIVSSVSAKDKKRTVLEILD
jgi:predicted RNA-binding protein YlqC (UPF0109 family)